MTKPIKYLLTALMLLPLFSFSQKVENVHFEQVGKQIYIYYDLIGKGTYMVKVYCSTDESSSWGNPLQKVSGNVGFNIKQGNNKKIIWDVLKEKEKLTGTINFKIEAVPNIGIEIVFVQGGTFQMGSSNGVGDNDEHPQHTVTVNDFYIGKYEVTQKQWKEIMGTSTSLSNPSYFKGDNLPVEYVSWNDVQKFIKKLNQKTRQKYRLPTEAEWEYAARGGSAGSPTKYAGSNKIANVAWYSSNSGRKTHVVGTKRANELGIYDMSGNVWEWCSDWYGSYSSKSQNNPQGASSGSGRVRRGGSWYRHAKGCRVAYRGSGSPDNGGISVGFRLILVP